VGPPYARRLHEVDGEAIDLAGTTDFLEVSQHGAVFGRPAHQRLTLPVEAQDSF
jgi:hypothetical protein